MEILFTKRLNKYYIIGRRTTISSVVKRLQDFGVFHINYIDVGLKLNGFKSDTISDIRLKNEIDEFLSFSKRFGAPAKGIKPLKKGVLQLVRNLTIEIPKLERQISALKSEQLKLSILRSLNVRDLSLLNYKGKISLLRSKHEEKIDCIRKIEFQKYWFYLVDANTMKANPKFEVINTDALERLVERSQTGAAKILEKSLNKLVSDYNRLKRTYKRLTESYGKTFIDYSYWLNDEIIRNKSIQKIADEGQVFIISCFAPRDFDINVLGTQDLKVIKSNFEPKEAPTVRPRGTVIKNFALLTWLYGTPKYNEIDPSFMVMVTFPLLFGAIVGDIGYGIILLIGAVSLYFLRKDFKNNLFWIFMLSGVSSVFFGAMFGEFFGNLIAIQPILFYRLNNVISLIIGSVISGSIILSVAFIFNLINAAIDKDKKKIIGGAGWLLLNSFILYEVFSIYFLGRIDLIATIIIPISAVFIGMGQIYEISQIFNLFTNVVSYLRIAAVGLSSVMIAILINQLGSAIVGYSVLLAILVVSVLHLLNIVLDSLIAFLQSLRLEYVEFLSKFLSGEGSEYEPLERYTEK